MGVTDGRWLGPVVGGGDGALVGATVGNIVGGAVGGENDGEMVGDPVRWLQSPGVVSSKAAFSWSVEWKPERHRLVTLSHPHSLDTSFSCTVPVHSKLHRTALQASVDGLIVGR